jgi:hypothetical protein
MLDDLPSTAARDNPCAAYVATAPAFKGCLMRIRLKIVSVVRNQVATS